MNKEELEALADKNCSDEYFVGDINIAPAIKEAFIAGYKAKEEEAVDKVLTDAGIDPKEVSAKGNQIAADALKKSMNADELWHKVFDTLLSKGDVYSYDYGKTIDQLKEDGFKISRKEAKEEAGEEDAVEWWDEVIGICVKANYYKSMNHIDDFRNEMDKLKKFKIIKLKS